MIQKHNPPLVHFAHLGLVILALASCGPQNISTPDLVSTPILETETVTPAASPAGGSDPGIVLYRADPQRTGVYNLPAIRHPPEVKWQTQVSSSWLVPPMLADGILYTGSGDGVLYALDAETGEQLWSAGGFGQLETTGAIAGDLIVTGGYSNLVQALDRHSGEASWSFRTDYAVQASPLIVDNRVYIATDHAVYALDFSSGELIWETATGPDNAFMAAPAYDDGVIYTTGGRLLLALEAETGDELWRVEKDDMFLGLTVTDQWIYVGNWDRNLYAFDRATGEERWKFAAGGEFWSAPAINGQMVYAGNNDRSLYALNAETGELIWSYETGGDAVSEPCIAENVVYVSDSSHVFPRGARHLYALDAATGEELWVFETISTFLPAPALGDGIIYIISAGDVIALL